MSCDDAVQSRLDDHADLTTDDDGRYDCRDVYRNFEFEADTARDGEEEAPTAEYRCGSWECYCCGYRMRMNLVEEIDRICGSNPEMRRLLTLTLDPEKAPDDDDEKHAYLTRRWNALRTELNDAYGDISYIWVREEGEESDDPHPHLHIIVDRYLPQSWLSSTWSQLGGGEVVDIRRIDRVEQAAHYIGKYLTKNALSGLPDGIRRYGSSQDITLNVRGDKGETERDWSLMMDDHVITDSAGEPLRRGVVAADFGQQKDWGGPVPPD